MIYIYNFSSINISYHNNSNNIVQNGHVLQRTKNMDPCVLNGMTFMSQSFECTSTLRYTQVSCLVSTSSEEQCVIAKSVGC
jgi:hypothetical protein